MKFYISFDHSDAESRKALPALTKFLREKKARFTAERREDENSETAPEDTDIIIAFGSSFNVLRTFRKNADSIIPVLGVSVYSAEFLPEITLDGFRRLFDRIIKKEYSIEERSRMEVEVDGRTLPPVLNDVVIAGQKSASTVAYSVHVDGKQMFRDEGDGLIVSTPTGSTGYSASSGGPVILQNSDVISLTPLSSMQQNRPLVVSGNSLINIKNAGLSSSLEIVCDGRFRYSSKKGEITVKRYWNPARFATINEVRRTPLEKLKNREARYEAALSPRPYMRKTFLTCSLNSLSRAECSFLR